MDSFDHLRVTYFPNHFIHCKNKPSDTDTTFMCNWHLSVIYLLNCAVDLCKVQRLLQLEIHQTLHECQGNNQVKDWHIWLPTGGGRGKQIDLLVELGGPDWETFSRSTILGQDMLWPPCHLSGLGNVNKSIIWSMLLFQHFWHRNSKRLDINSYSNLNKRLAGYSRHDSNHSH